MARSDPTRSDYCATRHLLRHIREPQQLRRNPLARAAFVGRSADAALRAISGRVSRALAAMDAEQPERAGLSSRRTAILLRVDVGRHDPAVVAADLGLSVRQFHRERRLAHDRFLAAFRASAPAVQAMTVDGDIAVRLVGCAVSLADSGETASARAILHDVVGSGGDAAVRCEALTRLAEIDAWAHRLDDARTHLQAADAVLAAAPTLCPDERARLRDGSDAVALCLRWFARGPADVERDSDGRFFGVRTTLVRAAAAIRAGESAHAARLLRRVDDAECAAPGPDVAVDVLTLRAELADFTAEDPRVSEELLTRAVALARTHGFGGRELYAKHQLLSTRWMHSRDARDRSAYRRLVDRHDRLLSPRLRSYLAFCAADIEVALGHPGRALEAARAAARVSTNAYEMLSARGLAAGALLRLGRIADAGTQAALAAEAARSGGHARVLSLAQRISAQAFLAQGNRRAARSAIEESIECARRFSSAHVLAQARVVLGRVTGSSRTIG